MLGLKLNHVCKRGRWEPVVLEFCPCWTDRIFSICVACVWYMKIWIHYSDVPWTSCRLKGNAAMAVIRRFMIHINGKLENVSRSLQLKYMNTMVFYDTVASFPTQEITEYLDTYIDTLNDAIRLSQWRNAWRRHNMETFSALLVLCERNPPLSLLWTRRCTNRRVIGYLTYHGAYLTFM